jgi:hypothetical protein
MSATTKCHQSIRGDPEHRASPCSPLVRLDPQLDGDYGRGMVGENSFRKGGASLERRKG